MHHILQYIFYYSKMFCALCKYDKKNKNKNKTNQNEPKNHHTIYTIN